MSHVSVGEESERLEEKEEEERKRRRLVAYTNYVMCSIPRK